MEVSSTLAAGLALGAVYALVGVAVSIVAITTRTLFLAVGPVLVAGVLTHLLLAVEVVTGLPVAVAALCGIAVGAALAASLQPLVLAPLPAGMGWLLGMAVAGVVVEAAAARLLGTETLRADPVLPLGAVGGVDGAVVTALVLALPLAALLALAASRTRWGRRFRILGASPAGAARSGISAGRTRAGVLAVGGAAAVAAGILAAPVTFVGVAQGPGLTVRGVAAALLLGRRGPWWALPGGVVLGLAEAVGQGLAPGAGGEVAVAVVVVAALVARGTEAEQAWGRVW